MESAIHETVDVNLRHDGKTQRLIDNPINTCSIRR
jgi:hypothetical protein